VGPARLRGSVFYPGGGSAVWPHSAGCVLCALWAVSAAVLGGGGYLVFVGCVAVNDIIITTDTDSQTDGYSSL